LLRSYTPTMTQSTARREALLVLVKYSMKCHAFWSTQKIMPPGRRPVDYGSLLAFTSYFLKKQPVPSIL